MTSRTAARLMAAALTFAMAFPAQAQSQPDKLQELERKIEALSQDLERIKLGAQSSAQRDKLSLGGYGEINATGFARKNQKGDAAGLRSATDLQRFVLLGEYRFSDRIELKFELEFEHAGTGQGAEQRGEAGVEQAYVDFRRSDALNARAGHLLVPLGLINENHEPPAFHGALRPSVETFIIPTTWHENGLGLWGAAGPASYESYVVAGLQAVPDASGPSVDGFTGSSGLRGSSSEGSRTSIEDLAWVSRVDVRPFLGASAGASVYIGQADQNFTAAAVPVTLWDVHAKAERRGAELRALYAEGTIGNADSVNAAQKAATPGFVDFVGRRQFGGYVEAAFNVLSLFQTTRCLAPFLRWERYDTQSRVPNGFIDPASGSGNARGANSRVEYVFGLTYKPVPNLAVKTDYQWKLNQARTGTNQWNLGLGFMF